jgi:hypothetical protein
MATSDPNDFSMLTDEELRPWAAAPEVDAQIEAQHLKLLTTMQNMNPTGGYEGASELDHMPDHLKEFEQMIRDDPEWIGEHSDGKEYDDGGYPGEMDEFEDPETTDLLSQDDGLLTRAIDDLNFLSLATDEIEDPMMSHVVAQTLIPQSLSNRRTRPEGKLMLKNLKSVKFVPNFGGPALHRVKAAGCSTLKVPQNRSHYSRPSSSSSYTRTDNMKQAKSIMSTFADRPTTSVGVDPARTEAMIALENEMATLKAKMDALKQEAEGETPAATVEETKSSSMPSLFAPDESKEDKDAALGDVLAPSPIKKVRVQAAMQADTATPNVLDSLLSKSASAPELPPRKLSKIGGRSPRSPKDRFEKRPASGALGKLGIGSTTGTASKMSKSQKKALNMFGTKRLKSIRTLRDQMMSTAGSMTAFSRNDNPGDAKLFDAQSSIRMTREQCKNTMLSGKADNTWELLVTPGFLDQVGPAEVFKSDSQHMYVADERYKKAIDPSTFDHTNGIPPSPLRIWAEDAVKSGRLPLFSSGGAMRVK